MLDIQPMLTGDTSHQPPQLPSLPRNPYAYKLHDILQTGQGLVSMNRNAESYRGRWSEVFLQQGMKAAPRSIWVEIGCNGGHIVIDRALRDPQTAFIGIDWKYKQIYRAYQKAIRFGLKNVFFIRADAARLPQLFAEGEIHRIDTYFPDPWPKNSHRENRLLSQSWFELCARLLPAGSKYEFRTDHADYFRAVDAAVSELTKQWTVTHRTTDKHKNHPLPFQLDTPEVTLFEKLFIKQGLPIHELHLQKLPIHRSEEEV